MTPHMIGMVLFGQLLLTLASCLLNGSALRFRGDPPVDAINRSAQGFIALAAAVFPFMVVADLPFPVPVAATLSATALSWTAVMQLRQALRRGRGIFA